MAPTKITREALIKLIEKQRADTLWNHLLTAISWDYSFQGVDLGQEIKLWKQNNWNRTFYPVHTYMATGDDEFVYAHSHLNAFGKVLSVILWIIPAFLVWTTFTNPIPFKAKALHTGLILGFAYLMVVVVSRFYRVELNYQLEDISAYFGLVPPKGQAKNEWTLKKMLFRLFAYPFCIFLIALSLIEAIPNGEYVYGVLGLIFSLTYLIADLSMILKKSKRGR